MIPLSASGLPEPSFIERDPAKVTAEMVALWEEITGKTLYDAQPERLFINVIAYRETLLRIAIQEAAKQNLVDFAQFPMIDYLGRFHDVHRLPASHARTVARFSKAAVASLPVLIEQGAKIGTTDGQVVFATDVAAEIPAGLLFVDVAVTCTVAGTIANGFLPGQVSRLVGPIDGIDAVVNLDPTTGGAEIEDTEPFRLRVMEAPEKYSTAGPEGAYAWHAKDVRQDITDVAVHSPRPGDIEVVILTRDGLPQAELLALVADRLNARDLRPMCDVVSVRAPTPVHFAISARIWLTRDADPVVTRAEIDRAAAIYVAGRRAGLGRDLVQSQIMTALAVPGVYKVEILAPADTVLGPTEWADGLTVAVEIMGRSDD